MIKKDDMKNFVKAGKSTFTIKNETSGGRFTFKVCKCEDKDIWFVKVLNGPDSYAYLGTIFSDDFRRTKNSRFTDQAPSFVAFSWLWSRLIQDNIPNNISMYHEGRCGRCGRQLTVPESIESGYGPICAEILRNGK